MTMSGEKTPGWTPRTAYVVALLTIVYAFNSVDRNLFGLMIPLIEKDMELSDTTIGLLSGFAFAIFYASAALPIASFADRSNRRNIIAVGLAFWSLMTALHGVVQNVWQLAIARFLLGAGEASSVAPSNSIIADLVRPEQRPLALGFLSMAMSLGLMFAFPVLGWVSEEYGWRPAFAAAGVPGILLALVLFLTVREPVRLADPAKSKALPVTASLRSSLGALLRTRAYVFFVLAGTMVSIILAITQTWLPAFLSRSHEIGQAELGTLVGFIRGPGGIIGALLGGGLTSYLGSRDRRWLYGVPACAMFLIAPALLLMLFSDSAIGWQIGMALEALLVVSTIGPMFALLMSAAGPSTRSVAVAFFLLVSNLFGQSAGPLMVGAVSDLLTPAYGAEALRYSMLSGVAAAIMAGSFCLAAGASLRPRAADDLREEEA
jgi:predicted MFS family arabinose efflux permease